MKYVQPYGVIDEDAPYINGDPSVGRAGSIPPAAAFEHPMREMVHLIDKAGFVPNSSDLWQLLRSVRQQVNYFEAFVTSGDVNDYYVVMDPALDQYRAGLRINVKIPVTNTGVPHIFINSLGARAIVRANGAVAANGDLIGGMVVELVDDGTRFQIVNFLGFTSGVTNNNNYIVDLPYAADTGAAGALVATFSPAITTLTAGFACLVKLGHDIPGASTLKVNALAAHALVHPDGTPLQNLDAKSGAILWIAYDGTSFQLANYIPPTRPVLTAPRTYYVNDATGSDTLNNGLGAGTAFKTIQRALVESSKWDNNGFNVTILVADAANYVGPVIVPRLTGSGTVILIGNHINPQNCKITGGVGTTHACGTYTFDGFHIENTGGIGLVAVGAGSIVFIVNMEFGFCSGAQIQAQGGSIGLLGVTDGYASPFIRMTSNADCHLLAAEYGLIDSHNPALIIANPLAVNSFIRCQGGSIYGFYSSIAGAANVTGGQKYSIDYGGIAHTGQGNSMPGPAAGYLGFGQYD